MTASKLKKPWDKTAFRQFQASLTHERRRQDAEELQKIFALAAKAPALKKSIDWARAHDIDFIIDRDTPRAPDEPADYEVGAGVVTYYLKSRAPAQIIAHAMAHEIRHGWQDYHGLLPTVAKNFENFYSRYSLAEADAMAHGILAQEQYLATCKGIPLPSENAMLWDGLKSWYAMADMRSIYGMAAIQFIEDELKTLKNTQSTAPYKKFGLKENNVTQLGVKFNGANYFPPEAPAFIKGTVLKSENAAAFYGAASPSQRQHVASLNAQQNGRILILASASASASASA